MHLLVGSLHNEWMKRKKRIYFIVFSMIILFLGIFVISILNERYSFIPSNATPNEAADRPTVEDKLIELQLIYDATPVEQIQEKKRLKNQIEWYSYHLSHDIKFEVISDTALDTLKNSMTGIYISFLFPIVMIVIGADILSSEMSSRTIKTMLLRPVGRLMIFHAKLLFVAGVSFLLLVCSYLLFCLLKLNNEWGDWTAEIVVRFGATLHTVPVWFFVFIGLGSNLISVLTLSFVLLCISYFFRNVSLSVVVSMMLVVFIKILLNPFLVAVPADRYYFMYHLDLVSHLLDEFPGNQHLLASLIVLLSTIVVCYSLVYFRINREDLPY
ncbi:ABC transporter permease subunit [Paenibacillus montanisoli]|uniref:ABC transporter permease n=1 Tax=Paenibacillus montanisoli TaxID=2081970 RepID=A0A328U1A4_9BACL|nr:ABC transporter permease subunit [Paenibacillus montanisoli]RAP73784.1 hypothetical protein DL346_26385 [Paenibacillus montanisoli]